jgi:hypothetical protein
MMRNKVFVLVLLLCGGFSLAAQIRPGVSVYVPPVSGRGSKTEDNTLFYNKLVFELTDQDFTLAKTQNAADFSLIGSLAPYGEGKYSFHLGLRNNKTGETTIEGELLYETPDDIGYMFPVLVNTLLYTIPESTVKTDESRTVTVPESTVKEEALARELEKERAEREAIARELEELRTAREAQARELESGRAARREREWP